MWSVWRWLSWWWLVLFYWGLMLLRLMGVEFENTCTVSGKWNVFRVIPRLYGWVCKTLRLSPLVIEYSVVVMTAGSQWRWCRLNPISCQFSIVILWNLSSESVGVIKFWDSGWSLRHWQSEFNYFRMEYLFAFLCGNWWRVGITLFC